MVGSWAGLIQESGERNVFIGTGSGNEMTAGSNNILIGFEVNGSDTTGSDQMNIGDLIFGNMASDYVGINIDTPKTELHLRGEMHIESEFNQAVLFRLNATDPTRRLRFIGPVDGSDGASSFTIDTNNELDFDVDSRGVLKLSYQYDPIFNYNSSDDIDLTVRSLNNPNMLFVDASADAFGINNATPNVELDVDGSIEYTGTLTDVSDRRLKDSIQSLVGALEKVLALDGKQYYMKKDLSNNKVNPRPEFGFIAQEVLPIIPDLVHQGPDGYYSMNYVGLIAFLVEAIKAQEAELTGMRYTHGQQINELQKQVARLSEILDERAEK